MRRDIPRQVSIKSRCTSTLESVSKYSVIQYCPTLNPPTPSPAHSLPRCLCFISCLLDSSHASLLPVFPSSRFLLLYSVCPPHSYSVPASLPAFSSVSSLINPTYTSTQSCWTPTLGDHSLRAGTSTHHLTIKLDLAIISVPCGANDSGPHRLKNSDRPTEQYRL